VQGQLCSRTCRLQQAIRGCQWSAPQTQPWRLPGNGCAEDWCCCVRHVGLHWSMPGWNLPALQAMTVLEAKYGAIPTSCGGTAGILLCVVVSGQ